jgi:hypothetical protein
MFDEGLQGRAVGDIDDRAPGLHAAALQGLHRLGDLLGVAGADGDIRALVGEALGDRAADAARPAGHHRHLALELQVHGRPLPLSLARLEQVGVAVA